MRPSDWTTWLHPLPVPQTKAVELRREKEQQQQAEAQEHKAHIKALVGRIKGAQEMLKAFNAEATKRDSLLAQARQQVHEWNSRLREARVQQGTKLGEIERVGGAVADLEAAAEAQATQRAEAEALEKHTQAKLLKDANKLECKAQALREELHRAEQRQHRQVCLTLSLASSGYSDTIAQLALHRASFGSGWNELCSPRQRQRRGRLSSRRWSHKSVLRPN